MDELRFDGRVAIVTGAGRGVGRIHAEELARRGARVVANDRGVETDGSGGSVSVIESVVEGIRAAGGEAVANTDSVATPKGGAAIIRAAVEAFGRVDIVVNNAGILRDASFRKVVPADLDAVVDVHLKGAFNVTVPAWSLMSEQGYGRVVNTTSGAGLFGNFGQSSYAAAKMGLVGLTRVLAIEGARRGIRVNAIAPIARTRMTEDVMGEKAEPYRPELVTPVVLYLAHECCDRTGQIYSVGAGRVRRVFIGATAGIEDPKLSPEIVAESMDRIDRTDEWELR